MKGVILFKIVFAKENFVLIMLFCPEKELHYKYRGKGKKIPSNESRKAMMKHLDLDYQLYRWVQQRFYNIYTALVNRGKIPDGGQKKVRVKDV